MDVYHCIIVKILTGFGEIWNAGKGTEQERNETFVFIISEGVSEITLKILDSDAGTKDDFVGEAVWVVALQISNIRMQNWFFVVFFMLNLVYTN